MLDNKIGEPKLRTFLVLCLVFSESISWSQTVYDSTSAKSAASAFAVGIGKELDLSKATVNHIRNPKFPYENWDITGENFAWSIVVRNTDGHITYFGDNQADQAIVERSRNKFAFSVKNIDQAWEIGEHALNLAGCDLKKIHRESSQNFGSESDLHTDSGNTSYRFFLTWREKPSGHEGWINQFDATIDAVSGKVLTLLAADQYSFEEPSTIISKEIAVGKFYEAWLELGRLRLIKDIDFPSEEALSRSMKLEVRPCIPGGSLEIPYAEEMARHLKARLVWLAPISKTLSIWIDAENGKLLGYFLSKVPIEEHLKDKLISKSVRAKGERADQVNLIERNNDRTLARPKADERIRREEFFKSLRGPAKFVLLAGLLSLLVVGSMRWIRSFLVRN